MYSEQELKEKSQQWLKDADIDPIKQERIKTIEALLRDVPYKSAEERNKSVNSWAASGLDIPFIVNYANQVKKVQVFMDTIVNDFMTGITLDTEHGKKLYNKIKIVKCDCGSKVAEVFDSIYYFEQDGSKHNCEKVKVLRATNNIDETQAVRIKGD